MPTQPVTATPAIAPRLTVSAKVRALLTRHGVGNPRQQLTVLMSIMNASYSQVYRKVNGRSSWLEEDLQRIVDHFGETLGSLFRDEEPVAPALDASSWLQAKVCVAGLWLPCRVTLDESPDASGRLVLEEGNDGPRVVDRETPSGKVRATVRQLLVDAADQPHGGFAVFDDDPDVAESIVDNLLARGEDAQAFFTTQDLRACPRRFDVYIIDWFSSDTSTAADLIQYLRTEHAPDSTIVVLTGQIQREHTEADLARLIHTHNVMVELKPMRVDLLLAKVKHLRQI
ncbi:MAG: helix-turn-helix domain-containing protein [Aquabacterium sp.]